ncbi:hypothetical protein MKZ38_001125 [Zalerion maritima]|uniref:Uncharacterized protein n=1 Tax=Zalerion maritima TaxID=339359 RepID=A0AAD5RQP2_9PEZI|nr:hypothetical protein MKZ38_001125 [Zalerion maritima]
MSKPSPPSGERKTDDELDESCLAHPSLRPRPGPLHPPPNLHVCSSLTFTFLVQKRFPSNSKDEKVRNFNMVKFIAKALRKEGIPANSGEKEPGDGDWDGLDTSDDGDDGDSEDSSDDDVDKLGRGGKE